MTATLTDPDTDPTDVLDSPDALESRVDDEDRYDTTDPALGNELGDEPADDTDYANDVGYLVIPEEVWLGQHPVPEEPEYRPDPESVREQYYLPPRESRPLALNTVTALGGVGGAVAFGLVTGATTTSPLGMVFGMLAGVFGGLACAALAEELYERRHR